MESVSSRFRSSAVAVLAAGFALGAWADAVVARIGARDYADLPTAFAEVQTGETITMVSNVTNLDITASAYLTLAAGKQVTFDLNGKTVYGENSIKGQSALLEVAGDLTVEDTSAEKTGRLAVKPLQPATYEELEGGGYGSILVNVRNGSLTINGGTLENLGYGGACYAVEVGGASGSVAVTVNGGAVRSLATVVRMYSSSGSSTMSLAVNGGLLESTLGSGLQYYAPDSSGPAAVSVAGGEIRAFMYALYAYRTDGGLTVDMTGGKMTATGLGYSAIFIYNSRPLAFAEQTEVTVSGGEVAGDILLQVQDYYGATHTTISGGNFSGRVYVYTYDNSYSDYFRRDEYCIRITGGTFADFGMVSDIGGVSPDSWFYWNEQSGLLLYGGTYDNRISTGVDYAGRVAEGYIYLDNFNGTSTVVRGRLVDGVPCALLDKTVVVSAGRPEGTSEEAWTAATNIVASVTTADVPDIVADVELTNAVKAAKAQCGAGETVTAVFAEVEVEVTPTGTVPDANGRIHRVALDVTPRFTTWAQSTNGVTVATNLVGAAARSLEYSGWPMTLSFNVANMTDVPTLIVRRQGGSVYRYTRGGAATETTFAYDAAAATVTLKTSDFGEIEILSEIQVGDTAFARVGPDGICRVSGTGDMWSYAAPGQSPLWNGYRTLITGVVVEGGVTSVGQNFFAYMRGVKDIAIGADVTNVAAKAFYHCTYVTNLVVGAGVRSVGENAFERCYSMETIRFGSAAVAAACQGEAFKITARITMNGGTPAVDAVPEVVVGGCKKMLKGKKELTDAAWDDIADPAAIPYGYHFFKYEYVPAP